jgi:L-lactate dehydrogenase complex protein LldE
VKRRVSLFVTCLVDQLRPEVGLATARVLERAGCEVEFDARQTCCAQPAFNSGFRTEARSVARHFVEVFERADAIVVPSGSCTSMVHHLPELFEDEPEWHARAERVAAKTHELAAYLVRELGATDLGARFAGRVAWHDACHGLRELGLRAEPRQLLGHVRGLELVEMKGAESCCGFGGTFSVKFPELSTAILDHKLAALAEARVDALASLDASCLMQIAGRLARTGSSVRTLHLAEILAAG